MTKDMLKTVNTLYYHLDKKAYEANPEKYEQAAEKLDDIREILEFFGRLMAEEESYIDVNFADKAFYYDGCIKYKDEDERKLIENFVKEYRKC